MENKIPTTQQRRREILEKFLKVMAREINFTVSRGEESGVIDFSKQIDQALSELEAIDRELQADHRGAQQRGIELQREEISRLESLVDKYEKALKIYADESNWGNGGFEGHPNDLFLLSRDQVDRAWKIAQEAIGKERGLVK